jgi:hypothetical protein
MANIAAWREYCMTAVNLPRHHRAEKTKLNQNACFCAKAPSFQPWRNPKNRNGQRHHLPLAVRLIRRPIRI